MSTLVQSTGLVIGRSRWWAFCTLCFGLLLVVIDGMVVNVALPSIQADLGFSQLSLIWVVNAYLITYSGFLLIGGRLADLLGHRRLFLFGIAVFTIASLVCGLARSRALLTGARAVQGLGGAVIAPVVLSLVGSLFPEGPERAKAMSILGFVNSSGASLGSLLGGTLTGLASWHWIFLINLPLGAAAYALGLALLPGSAGPTTTERLDVAGAATVTVSLLLAVYGIVNATKAGWISVQTITLLTGAIASLILFLYIETRVPSPIIPLSLFRKPNLIVIAIIIMLWAFTISAWYLISALYMQIILRYTAEQIGFAFLPVALVVAALSPGVSVKLVTRFGTKRPLVIGLLIASAGMALFARAPLHGDIATDVLPGMFLVGLGAGTMGSSMFLIAMKGMVPSESGFISGILSTASLMGSALGVAILISAASVCTNNLLTAGVRTPVALTSGYHLAFSVGAGFVVIAALIGAAFLPAEEVASKQLRA